MAQKNRYLFRARISEVRFRVVLRLFCADLTAETTADLARVNRKTALAIFTLLRQRMVVLAARDCPFHGIVEVDESYFGARRVRGQPGRGAGRKTPVFGILERGGRVHCQVVKNCSKATLQAIITGKVTAAAEVHSDGFRSYDGLVEAGFAKHHRISHGAGDFAKGQVHINGIESFWSYAKRRLAKFNGIPTPSFPAFLKECEFRFNTRHGNLYAIMLNSCRIDPLRAPQLD
jgi:transposase